MSYKKQKRPVSAMSTKVFFETYEGHKLFAVWEVDDSGNKISNWPVVSIGVSKAEGVLKHFEELKAFVHSNVNIVIK